MIRRTRAMANILLRGAASLLPDDFSSWGDAMKAEVQAIEKDEEALRFAAGCFWCAIKMRGTSMSFITKATHSGLVFAMSALALSSALVSVRFASSDPFNAGLFALLAAIFGGVLSFYLRSGPVVLMRAAGIVLGGYIIALVSLAVTGDAFQQQHASRLHAALAIEGVVMWAIFLAASVFLVRNRVDHIGSEV